MKPISCIRIATASLLMLALSSCAYAPWERSGVPGTTPDERVANAIAAAQKDPEAIRPRRDEHMTREQSTNELLEQAERAMRENRPGDAEGLFARVLAIEPANARAQSGQKAIKREAAHAALVEEARGLFKKGSVEPARNKVHQVLLERPDHADALALQEEIRRKQAVHVRTEPPRLKPPFDKPVTLELRDANIKMVFEALSRTTGINFILDKDIKQDAKATVFIKKLPVEEAIDMVLSTNGLQKKALSETSALVFPNTPAKLKDYQDLIIRSFYLTNASAKSVSALLKTMLKTKDIHVDERLNMLVIRDTPEIIRIAEKLVAANDMADPEVMLEMEVLEVTRGRMQELGIQYPSQLAVATTGTATALTLDALHKVTAATVNVSPNPAVNFSKTTSDVNLLANPRIRVRNNEKAKVHVGDKVPVITTTSTANVGVSESVQYVDVGLKLEVEPRITLDDNVNIKIGLEVASIVKTISTNNGGLVYQLGTRNANTILRLKDGETQVLAGLISDEERENAKKLPGLGDIPLIGRLFATQKDEKNKTEIVLAITPRIINNIYRPESEIQEYWSGTEAGITDRPQIVMPAGGGNGGGARGALQRPVPAPQPEPVQDPVAAEPPKEEPATPTPDAAAATKEEPEPVKPVIDPASPPARL